VGERPGTSGTGGQAPRAGWKGYGPAAFVVVALLAVLLLPFPAQRQISALRDEIELRADPARTLTAELRYLLASQTAALRGYLITRDEGRLQRYQELRERERARFEELERLVVPLGTDAVARFAEFRTLAGQWDERVAAQGLSPLDDPAALGDALVEEDLYIRAIEAANRLDDAVAAAVRARRERMFRVAERAGILQGVLILLALGAVASVVAQGRRVERLRLESDRRRAEVERALQETARAVESRARLIRGVTHDLKNPLGAADAYGELMELGLKGELTAPQRQVVAGIRRSIRSALETINEMLELSRAETGALHLERQSTPLCALVREVVDDYQGAVQASGHSLRLDLPAEGVEVFTDRARVKQVLGNLLSNAVKHTPPPGRLRVGLELRPEGADAPRPGHWAAVHVEDTGAGISPAEQERIFDEFHRLPGTTAAGHGLGLAISRRIARLLGGEVTLRSEPGSGSRFTLWLPVRSPDAGEEAGG
jgi:signal transduction histidine kinase